MSTPNFRCENRCIIVTDADYENGFYPELTGTYHGSRSYPSIEIDASEYGRDYTPKYHAIVITAGYYSDACIDFVETDYSIAEEFSYLFNQDTAKEVINELAEATGLSCYRIGKLAGKLNGRDICDYWEAACEAVDEYLQEQEREVCNAICDYIKSEYGLSEYGLSAIASNGEATYSKIG